MAARIIMPQGGQTTAESLIVRWYKNVGDPVSRGDVLFDIETDKATLQVESHAKGILLARLYEEGAIVAADQVVAYVGEAGEQIPSQSAPAISPTPVICSTLVAQPVSTSQSDPDEDEYMDILPPAVKVETPAVKAAVPATVTGPLMASPIARSKAKTLGVSLPGLFAQLGRPVKAADISAHPVPATVPTSVTRIPTGTMRKTIARRLTDSVRSALQFTVTMELDMSACRRLRELIANQGGKVAYHDILMLCVGKAIAAWPLVNGVYGEEEITLNADLNMGIAVGLPAGLVVPVVKAANRMGLKALAMESSRLIGLARQGKLAPANMTGGTMTLSNLGMFGVRRFDAILNPPESCILALGAIEERPAVVEGQLAIRPLMSLTATFDHRLVDGAYGAGFLQALKALAEVPQLLLYES